MLGMELMKIVPGRVSKGKGKYMSKEDEASGSQLNDRCRWPAQVSTECDAHLALDEKATTEKVGLSARDSQPSFRSYRF